MKTFSKEKKSIYILPLKRIIPEWTSFLVIIVKERGKPVEDQPHIFLTEFNKLFDILLLE